jgi:hypothetical protein
LADLLVELVLLGFSMLAHLLATVAEDVRQAGQGLFLPSTNLRTVDAEHRAIWAVVLWALMALHSDFGLQAGRPILTRSGH